MKKAISTALAKEDGGLADMPSIIEKIGEDYDAKEALAQKVGELEGKVRELQDSNLKLFLAQTGGESEEEEELDGMEAVDAFWDDLLKEG